MKGSLLKVLGILSIIAVIVSFVLALLGMVGAVKIGNGCFLRYDGSGTGNADSISNTIKLHANANYKSTTVNLPPPAGVEVIPDPEHYNEWVNTDLAVEENQEIRFRIEGEISLCKAYLPKNNLQFTESSRPGKSDLDDKDEKIVIPRVTDVNSPPISLSLDAKSDEWRNIAELYNNDRVMVSISPHYKTGDVSAMLDTFKHEAVTADCAEGKITYSPICNRYSIYSGTYVNDCNRQDNYWKCNRRRTCTCEFLGGSGFACAMCWLHNSACCKAWWCDDCEAWVNVNVTAPEPYHDDGKFVFPWSDDVSKLFFDFDAFECSYNSKIPPNGRCPDSVTDRSEKNKDYIIGQFQRDKKFWYTADWSNTGPTGLVHRLDSSGAVDKNLGSSLDFSRYAPSEDQPEEYNNKYNVIYNIPLVGRSIAYLQYRLWSKAGQDATKNTGGYVLNIKQTKCFRRNGNSFDDVFVDRGRVQYIVVPYDENPNDSGKNYPVNGIDVSDSEGNASITIGERGYLWMKILNKPEDYEESEGVYMVKFFTSNAVGSFSHKVMIPLLDTLKKKISNASQSIFKNMVCYKASDTSSCTNFFNYIKAMLVLYVMSFGAMFLLGMVKMNYEDLIMRVAKIAMVAGLLNGSTFEFFNNYVFHAITGFSDETIANMSGYSLFSHDSGTSNNPFMFMDAVMSKIFFSKTFVAQMMALLSMGLSGLIFFVVIFIAVMIVVITAFRAVAVYIMAFMATALLIGIAPLFLTFVLFDFTRYLFDNWVRFTIRYMIEPVVLLAGIIVLTQLFTIYLDFVLGYSVCWKCAIPIKIPFVRTILPVALLDVPIFCINWFAPWGMDYRLGMMGVNMQHIIAIIIISYGMYGYVEFSGRMVVKLTSTAGPSATGMGLSMSDAAETSGLKRIGMDEKSRQTRSKGEDDRLKARNRTLDRALRPDGGGSSLGDRVKEENERKLNGK